MKRLDVMLLLGWLALIVLGIFVNRGSPLRPAPVEPAWVAARDLPANTQLADGDLQAPAGPPGALSLPPRADLAGKYLRAGKRAGERIEPAELGDRPHLPEGAVTFVYPLGSAEAALARLLAPGDRVRLCTREEANTTGACTASLGVLATRAGNAAGERWLLLDVTGAEADLRRVLAAGRHFVLRDGAAATAAPEGEP